MKLPDIWAVPSHENPPANLSRIRDFYKEGTSIFFDGGYMMWRYESEKDRDKDYQMLMDKIS